MSDNKCSVLTVTEHWKSNEQLKSYKLNNYKLAAKFCREAGTHGGAAVYCLEELPTKVRSDINALGESYTFECAAVEVNSKKFNGVVVALYRTPDSDVDYFLRKMQDVLELLSTRNDNFFIAGDFNIDFKNLNNKNTQSFVSLLESYNVNITVNEYTRVNNISQSCIDNILTNVHKDAYSTEVINSFISDHKAQKLCLKILDEISTCYKYVRQINEVNINTFLNLLKLETWSGVTNIEESDVNSQWNAFITVFVNIFNHCFPVKKVKNVNNCKNKNVNINTPEISNCKQQLSTLSVMMKYNDQYKNLYNSKKKELESLFVQAKKQIFHEKIKNSDNVSKSTWEVVDSVSDNLKRNKNIPIIFQGNPADTANKLNMFFINSASDLVNNLTKIPFKNSISQHQNDIIFDKVGESEIIDIVKSLKNKNSSGYDEIPTSLIKKCIHTIVTPLCYIINNSIQNGIFPESLKIAVVIPVHKRGDTDLIENFRPISLLPTFSKIFEKVVSRRLTDFFNEYDLFNKIQHGFVRGRNINTAIFEYVNEILTTLEEKEIPLGIFLDISKAYDSINHEILLQKLERYGIRKTALKWIKSYLENRQQLVKISSSGKEIKSRTEKNKRGIPQGSIIGPLLFNIYLNDLGSILSHTNHLMINYADDTTLLIRAKSFNLLLVEAGVVLNLVQNWFLENELVLNKEKTNFIIFRLNHCRINFPSNAVINGDKVEFDSKNQFLGISVDCTLNWSEHVSQLTKKLNSISYSIRVVKKYVSSSTMFLIYYACFVSRLKFGILLWGGTTATNINQVFIIQKQVLRTLLDIPFRETCRGSFKKHRLLTVPAIYAYECLMFNFKYKNNFIRYENTHPYSTRYNNYNFPIHRLSMSERGPCYSSMKLFNILPNKLKSIENIKQFKREIFNYLIKIEPYTVEELLNHKE